MSDLSEALQGFVRLFEELEIGYVRMGGIAVRLAGRVPVGAIAARPAAGADT